MEVKDRLIVDMIFNGSKAIQGLNQFERAASKASAKLEILKKDIQTRRELSQAGMAYNKHGQIIDKTTKRYVKYEEQLKRVRAAQARMRKSTGNLHQQSNMLSQGLLSLAMSTFFAGMAINMLGRNILTSLVTAFVKARGEGDFFVNKLLAMQAAFEFLKFAIFDAFANSDWFIPLIDGIISVINWVSGLIAKYPELSKIIVIGTLAAIAFGAVLMVIGFFAQTLLAIVSILTTFGIVSEAALLKFGIGMKAATAATLKFIATWALPVIALAALTAFIIVTKDRWIKQFEIFWDETKLNWKRGIDVLRMGWENLSLGVELFYRKMLKAIVEGSSWAVEKIVGLINKAIAAYMLLPRHMRAFGDINQIEFKGFNTTAMTAGIDAAQKKMSDLDREILMNKAIYDLDSASNNTRAITNIGGMAMDWNAFLKDTFGFKEGVTEAGSTTTSSQETTVINNNEVKIEIPEGMSKEDIVTMMDEYFSLADRTFTGTPYGGA